jgi:hypothetical protein
MPGEVVRGLVSLWLIFHFFGVVLALLTNPAYEPATSQLVAKLKTTPLLSQYMFALWLDVPHNYRWTNGDPQDADHTITVAWEGADGKQQREFPPSSARGDERERYQALVRRIAGPIYYESSDRELMRRIGEQILQQSGGKEATFSIERHNPLSMQDAAADDPGQRDPYNKRTKIAVYTGSVTLNSSGQGEVHNPQQALDVAPVTNPSERPSERSGTKSKGNSGASNGASGQEAPPLPPTDSGKKPAALEMLKGLSQPENRSQ